MNERPLRIAILGPQTRSHDLLAQFVEHTYRSGMLVDVGQADVCLIDLDGFGMDKVLRQQRQCRPDQPVIVLAFNEPEQDGCVWVKKPLQAGQLIDALEKVGRPDGKSESVTLKVIRQSDESSSLNQAARQLASKHGVNHRAVHTVSISRDQYYNPEEYLQGVLVKVFQQAITTGISLRIDTGWEPIFVYPHKRMVWVDADDKKLQAFCHLSIRKFSRLAGKSSSRIDVTPEPMAVVDGKLPDGCQRMEAFLWKVSWWNSAGRLPRGVKSSCPIRLKRWPNLTRLWCPDSALQIASLLYQSARSPEETVTVLGVAPEDVYSFISAARAIGLIERIEGKRLGSPEGLPTEERWRSDRRSGPGTVKFSGGFLRKILRRLRGG